MTCYFVLPIETTSKSSSIAIITEVSTNTFVIKENRDPQYFPGRYLENDWEIDLQNRLLTNKKTGGILKLIEE